MINYMSVLSFPLSALVFGLRSPHRFIEKTSIDSSSSKMSSHTKKTSNTNSGFGPFPFSNAPSIIFM